jgi:hypothetical protein
MRIKRILSVCILVKVLCIQLIFAEEQIDKVAILKIEGNFASDLRSEGYFKFILYDDKTIDGNWETKDKTVSIKSTGFYIKKGSEIFASCFGTSFINSVIERNIIIWAYGKIDGDNTNGSYNLIIEDNRYKNDKGSWSGKIID